MIANSKVDAPFVTPLNMPPRKFPALPRLMFMLFRVCSIVVQNFENWSAKPRSIIFISSILNDDRLFVIVTTKSPRMKNTTANTMINVSNTASTLLDFGFLIEASSPFSNLSVSGLRRYVNARPSTSGFRTAETLVLLRQAAGGPYARAAALEASPKGHMVQRNAGYRQNMKKRRTS